MNTKIVTCDIKSQDARRISFIASHEKIDRDSELIVVGGIDTTEFEKNPVLLLQHDPRNVAVARVTGLRKTSIDGSPALVGEAVFPYRPQSEEALADVHAGLLNSVSIGFRVREIGPPQLPGQTGPTYVRTKLLEISLVTLPACATCLVTQKNACSCDDVLPSTGEIVVPNLTDDLSRRAVRSFAGMLSPAYMLALDAGEENIDPKIVNGIMSNLVTREVVEAVRREVRSKILFLCGRVD